MTETVPLQSLLDQLCRGDNEAARSAFVVYEPYLRMVVRSQLSMSMRVRFDSIDVVQSVWADLLNGFRSGAWCFDSPDQLRAFLVRATRNRLIDRVRRERRVLRHERSVDPASLHVMPETERLAASEGLEVEELWQKMLAMCPQQHRQLLELKRQGLPLADIATRTGLHESSVRRVLYRLAARMAGRDK